MTIVNLEESAFNKMMAAFESLTEKVEQVCKNANKGGLCDTQPKETLIATLPR